MDERRLAIEDGSLVELLDRLLTSGVAADGDAVITLAGVELIRLDLHVVLASIGTQGTAGLSFASGPARGSLGAKAHSPSAGAGVAGLVLAIVDLLRRLLECQALRRMHAGTVTAEEVERLGKALMSLETQTGKLATLVREQIR
ncbi:MAG TPA: gas vesicle protein GvpJ [Candidatus Limnocylindrales bacterium]